MASDKVNKKCSSDEPKGMAALTGYIWNSKTGEFFGRTGSSWVKIILFYLVFYACLAAFWALMLFIFMETINDDRPKWTLEQSIIGSNPGLGFRPSPPADKIDTTLIQFRPSSNASYSHWKNDLDKFLSKYHEAKNFPVNLNNNPCGVNYGYSTGSPCIIVKLNRIFDWVPQPYRSVSELMNHRNSKEDSNVKRPTAAELPNDNELKNGMVVVVCSGENAVDKENVGEIEYWPQQGFPNDPLYFPYQNQKGYLSPFVIVRFKSPKPGVLINIECVAYDKNIAVKRQDREGTVHLELLVDQ